MKMKIKHQNVWDTANVVLRQTYLHYKYIIKKEKSQINNLNSYFKKLEKGKNNPKQEEKTQQSSAKEIRTAIRETENRKHQRKSVTQRPGSLQRSIKLTNIQQN